MNNNDDCLPVPHAPQEIKDAANRKNCEHGIHGQKSGCDPLKCVYCGVALLPHVVSTPTQTNWHVWNKESE